MVRRGGYATGPRRPASSISNQHQRVLSLSVLTRFADPLGDRPIPFTELVIVSGGDGRDARVTSGRMRDRSAAVAALHYTWPIGPWIGGNIEAAVGNVFGEHLEGFRARPAPLLGRRRSHHDRGE